MGITASVADLENNMTEADLRGVFGSSFEPQHFHALRDECNMVRKDFFEKLRRNNIEREIYSLFMSYCPLTGELGHAEFVQFFVNTGLLKLGFNRPQCDNLFHRCRTQFGMANNDVNFYLFLEVAIPQYCKVRQVPLSSVLDYLSRLEEEPDMPITTEPNTPSISRSNSTRNKNFADPTAQAPMVATPTTSLKYSVKVATGDTTPSTKKRENSFTHQLQRLLRESKNRKKTQELKPMPSITSEDKEPAVWWMSSSNSLLRRQIHGSNDPMCKETEPSVQNCENTLSEAFNALCRPGFEGEMDKVGFLMFCKNFNLISKQFSVFDAETIFRTSIAKISFGNDDALKNCIFFDKRVNIVAFRSVVLPAVADHISSTLDEFLQKIVIEQDAADADAEKPISRRGWLKREPTQREETLLAMAYPQ